MDESAPWAALERHLPAAIELQRELHRRPERSGAEAATRDRVLLELPHAEDATRIADTGAVVRIGPDGPCIALRAELDALPITEEPAVPWASERCDVMHACGHDVHLAALTAVARALDDCALEIPALIVLQPREETYPSGARDIVREGVLATHECAAIVGAHLQPILRAGEVGCVPGGVNASCDEFELRVLGTAGHAAYPHLTADPLLTLAEIVVAAQSIISRSVDPMTNALLGVSSFTSGAAPNAVPDRARATGTIRALDSRTRTRMHERLGTLAQGIARAHGCVAEVAITHGEPVLSNDSVLAESIVRQLDRQDITLASGPRSLGSDDFSYFSESVPGVMLFVGTEYDSPLHSPRFRATSADVRMAAKALLAGYLGAAETMRGPV